MSGPDCEQCGEYFLDCRCEMAWPKGNCLNPDGRPQKDIDWELFQELCELQCTQVEIANCLKIHPNTLSDRVKEKYKDDYSMIYKKYSDKGKTSLRRYQYLMSKKNPTMAIWLGKNWLGQKDAAQEAHATEELTYRYLEVIKQLATLQSSNASSSL